MAKAPKLRAEQTVIVELRERLARLRAILPTLSRPAATKTMAELLAIMGEIEEARGDLDPIKEPGASFDPTNPDTAGRLVALALVAQDKVPLARIARTYGSGVYAIYYHGDHPAYAVVSGTETPIYVGKADPKSADARTSREQGPQLYGRLAAFPRQNGLAIALREVGRLERTLFTLDWIRNLDLRRRAHAGLNKGEARNALARAIFFNRLGELRDRQFENQVFRASGLNLLVAAIILWNSRYLAAAFDSLDQRGEPLAPEIKKHTVPLGWEHISLTGDYVWNDQRQPAPGELRPLRRPPSLLVA
jgi:hypothetical protein